MFLYGISIGVLVTLSINNNNAIITSNTPCECEQQPNNQTTPTLSLFNEMHNHLSVLANKPVEVSQNQYHAGAVPVSPGGGLDNSDRDLLASIYFNTSSLFEFGLGESTHITAYVDYKPKLQTLPGGRREEEGVGEAAAARGHRPTRLPPSESGGQAGGATARHVHFEAPRPWCCVPRYSGVDNEVVWVGKARDGAKMDHFRFSFADTGKTSMHGNPINDKMQKIPFNYQSAPLDNEAHAFDFYLVDGRYRVATACSSFLHAISRGGDMSRVMVGVHS